MGRGRMLGKREWERDEVRINSPLSIQVVFKSNDNLSHMQIS